LQLMDIFCSLWVKEDAGMCTETHYSQLIIL
jgi:hypothetical protein